MSQRNILENAISTLNQWQGPGKVLTAPYTLAAPVRLEQIIDPTGGGAATGWTAFGLTSGGINVVFQRAKTVKADVDQILGSYGQRLTGRGILITTQLAEVFDSTQMAWALDQGTPTQVSTTGPTQVLIGLDSTSNQGEKRRVAVVMPKDVDGRVAGFFFRNVEISGGDKTWRIAQADAARIPFEMIGFPENATTIPVDLRYGYELDIIGGVSS